MLVSSFLLSIFAMPPRFEAPPGPQLRAPNAGDARAQEMRRGIVGVNAYVDYLNDHAEAGVLTGLNLAGAYMAGEAARRNSNSEQPSTSGGCAIQ